MMPPTLPLWVRLMKQVMLMPMGEKISVKTEQRVLDAILSKELKVMMACGGKGLCATCHCQIEAGMDQLTPMTEREKRTLARVTGADAKSRLSCQAKILGEGVVVRLPDGVFIESTKDLESLVGQRAVRNILNPVDGSVLVEQGKIIIRAIQPDTDLASIAPLASTQAFLRHLGRLNGANAWALLGVWYVLEGSKNGGRHLAKAVARAFSGPNGAPTQYLDPYGDDQQTLWAAFKGGMDALPLDAGAKTMLQRVSAMTFDAVTNICREIMGEEPLSPSSGAAACPHMAGTRG